MSEPLLPVTRRVYVPTDDPCEAVNVRVDVATEFGWGTMGLGRLKDTPLGADPFQETDKATSELNAFCESTVITELPADP
jgi:hypothetical protein